VKRRDYKTYKEYLAHQAAKTKAVKAGRVRRRRFADEVRKFSRLLAPVKAFCFPGARAVCLGARQGGEVQALIDMGYEAVGVDLVAFEPLVVAGDFHDLPFGDASFDLVFSNAIDHVFDLDKVAAEIVRVTRPGAYVLLHLMLRRWSDEVALQLDSSDEMSRRLAGFETIADKPITHYGGGLNHLLLMRKGD